MSDAEVGRWLGKSAMSDRFHHHHDAISPPSQPRRKHGTAARPLVRLFRDEREDLIDHLDGLLRFPNGPGGRKAQPARPVGGNADDFGVPFPADWPVELKTLALGAVFNYGNRVFKNTETLPCKLPTTRS